jgi:hypothetical protein
LVALRGCQGRGREEVISPDCWNDLFLEALTLPWAQPYLWMRGPQGNRRLRKPRSACEDWMVLGAICPHAMLRVDHDGVLTECTGSGTSDGLEEARCATSSGSLYICVPRSSLQMRGFECCQSTSSPGTAWCSAYARPSPRHASPWSVRSATGAQRLSSAGTLVRVLAPPVKAGISQGRSAHRYPPRRCGAADSMRA